MRQQVNLIRDGFAEPKVAFSATHILMLSGGLIALLGLFSLGLAWRGSALNSDLASVTAEKNAEGRKLEDLQTQLAALVADPVLEAEQAKLERDVGAREKLVNLLGSESAGNMDGFSAYMRGLAKHPIAGVWLTQFNLAEGGQKIDFSGVTTRPENLPGFLQGIGEEPAFQGRSFERMEIAADEDDESSARLTFGISTGSSQ